MRGFRSVGHFFCSALRERVLANPLFPALLKLLARAGQRREEERIDKVRSALGEAYNMELHYAIAHMRRWDGAYPELPTGAKAVDLLKTEKGPRCVALV